MAVFTHIISTEHSGSEAFGSAEDYLKEMFKQAEESGEEEMVMILADYFSMTSLVPFYHACTHKNKYNDKVKPVMGLKVRIQKDKSINLIDSHGGFSIDEKGFLIKDEGDEYAFVLNDCLLVIDEEKETTKIMKAKKVIIDESSRLTDDGVALIKAYTETRVKKPAFDKDHDVIVIAKGDAGRRNINRLVSLGYQIELDSDYKKVNLQEFKENTSDMILVTGGIHGSLEDACSEGKYDLAEERLSLFKNLFDEDDIYLQVQRVENTVSGQAREERVIEGFKILSEKHGCHLFASNDVRFPKKENYRDVIIRKKAMEKNEMYNPSDIIEISEEQYLKPTMEMISLFSDIPDSITNTIKLTKKTDQSKYRDQLYQSYLPKFPIPKEFDNIEGISQDIIDMEEGAKKEKEITDFKSSKYLKSLSYEGLKERWPRICKEQNIYIGQVENKNGNLVTQEFIDNLYAFYESQIEMELEVIHRTGFPGYFLIVQDLIKWCKRPDIGISVGPGRGSGAGSIVLYCLQITEIDSIRFDLLFERFLNPERVGEPDIDVDFSPRNRKLVIKYMADLYGVENTAQILTYGTMAAKDVIDNVGRVLGLQPSERDRIKDLVSGEPGTKLKNELDPEVGNERLLKLRASSPQVDMILTCALELEGSTKSYGRHAGGVVVSYGEMPNYAGLYQESKDQGVTDDEEMLEEMTDDILVPTVQVDKDLCETVGLIKFDLLGLKNLDIRDDCIKFLNRTNPDFKNFEASDIETNDSKAIDLFKRADTYGIFQFESPAMRRLMKSLHVESFPEVIALVALFRPGPLQSGMAQSFVDRKHGIEKLVYPHKDLSVLLKDTYGTIIYQEQVMSISRILAGFTRGEADTLRKAMGKKILELMEKMRKMFSEGAGHKYREEIEKTTSEKWLSTLGTGNMLKLDINLKDMEDDFVRSLFTDELDQEYVDKMIVKFNFFGDFIYRKEQVISILKEFAELTAEEEDELFESIDLMKDIEFMKLYKNRILEKGMPKLEAKGLSKEDAEIYLSRLTVASGTFIRFNVIFSTMNEFAAYGFNASHSVAYATISMQTAYLKAHFPAQYMAALLSNESNLDKLSITARECRRMGINIMKPNINRSNLAFEALSGNGNEKNVRYGLSLIKGIAKKALPFIERRNEYGKINDIYEFYNVFADYKTREIVKRKGIVKEQQAKVINKTVFNALLNAGALDCLCPEKDSNYRPMLLSTYHHIDNTLTDLKKRLKKNFTEIKKKINGKKFDITHTQLLENIAPESLAFLGLDLEVTKDVFLNELEVKLVPEEITKYNLDVIMDIYNTTDSMLDKSGNFFGLKSLVKEFEEMFSFGEDFIVLEETKSLTKEIVNKINEVAPFSLHVTNENALAAIRTLKENDSKLSINMMLQNLSSTKDKLDKTVNALIRVANKKTGKPKEKTDALEKIHSILTSNEYLLSVIFVDFKNESIAKLSDKAFNFKTTEQITSAAVIDEAMKNDQIKFNMIMDIESELRVSHSGEEIEMTEFTVNGRTHYYVIPSSKETDLVPYLNTKDRSLKEFAVTGMYQTSHPLIVDSLSSKLMKEGYNLTPLSNMLAKISREGDPTRNDPNKHYYNNVKVAGTILDISDFRTFNERDQRMETKITLVVDDGSGVITAKFAAEDIFSPGREEQGIKMLLDIKKKKSDVILFEGNLTQGGYESEGAIMYVKSMGSANPEIYLPVFNPELNKVEVVEAVPASEAQLNFVKSLLNRHKVPVEKILESYNVESLEKLTKVSAGDIINTYA